MIFFTLILSVDLFSIIPRLVHDVMLCDFELIKYAIFEFQKLSLPKRGYGKRKTFFGNELYLHENKILQQLGSGILNC